MVYKRNTKTRFYSFLIPILLILTLGIIFLSSSAPGKVILGLETSYQQGESLSGFLKLNLNEGELIPADSRVVVNLNGESREFLLSELIDAPKSSGTFYAEGTGISGSGDG